VLFRWVRLSVSSKQGDVTLCWPASLVRGGIARKRLAPLPGSRCSLRVNEFSQQLCGAALSAAFAKMAVAQQQTQEMSGKQYSMPGETGRNRDADLSRHEALDLIGPQQACVPVTPPTSFDANLVAPSVSRYSERGLCRAGDDVGYKSPSNQKSDRSGAVGRSTLWLNLAHMMGMAC
jgi:hypothetical protein